MELVWLRCLLHWRSVCHGASSLGMKRKVKMRKRLREGSEKREKFCWKFGGEMKWSRGVPTVITQSLTLMWQCTGFRAFNLILSTLLAIEFQFSSFENTKILFSFSIIHIQIFEYLSHENSDPKLSQTDGHLWNPLSLDDRSWKLSDVTQFSWSPNKL